MERNIIFRTEYLETIANLILFNDKIYSNLIFNRLSSLSEKELVLEGASFKDLVKIRSYEENCGSPLNIAYFSIEKKAIVTRDLTVWVKYNDRFY